jgi:hypothetical protein
MLLSAGDDLPKIATTLGRTPNAVLIRMERIAADRTRFQAFRNQILSTIGNT